MRGSGVAFGFAPREASCLVGVGCAVWVATLAVDFGINGGKCAGGRVLAASGGGKALGWKGLRREGRDGCGNDSC